MHATTRAAVLSLADLRDVALLARDARQHGDQLSYELHTSLILTALIGRERGEGANGRPEDDVALRLVAPETYDPEEEAYCQTCDGQRRVSDYSDRLVACPECAS